MEKLRRIFVTAGHFLTAPWRSGSMRCDGNVMMPARRDQAGHPDRAQEPQLV